MKGLLPWLSEAIFGKAEAKCVHRFTCNAIRHHDCGAGACAYHCRIYCQGDCKKPPPKLGVVLGMRR